MSTFFANKFFIPAIEWCALRKFELIELEHSDPQDIMDLEEDQSKYGIDRIIEALETHMWPNINMKGYYHYHTITGRST